MTTTLRDLSTAHDALLAAFAEVPVRGLIHAVDIDTGHEIGVGSDESVVSASVFKVPVLVELCRQYSSGRIDPRARIALGADERRTDGSTGISVMLDELNLSVRDMSLLMMSVSDNRATDVITDLVGLDNVNATMREFGFDRTVVDYDCDMLFATIMEDLGDAHAEGIAELEHGELTDDLKERLRVLRATTPEETDRTTPRQIAELLSAIWRDELLDADAAAEVRRVMGLQAWGHRLTAGFSDPAVRVSGKTGTLFYVRNEVGVVEFPTGERFAVAVFLQEPTFEPRNPDADRVIGTAARLAVDYLRASQSVDAG
ncbi:hypothetical protein ASD65_07070 [Microbacterium sp. Root61]|uniref:serine hydrolase n=1 Tax=Microbacterium sp. Root61 TaxID=1736570 RepID=UPI0006F93CEE|nr:serine hydrolase [Microbacterium sp. Root61]KRA24206.1 hypothetical protein ASD65_07070 [Microbacterium sp. Root61]